MTLFDYLALLVIAAFTLISLFRGVVAAFLELAGGFRFCASAAQGAAFAAACRCVGRPAA